MGTLLPLILIYHPQLNQCRKNITLAALLVLIGGFSLLYVIIIGGQAYPLDIFPGMEVTASDFFDNSPVHPYIPSHWEIMLGIGGIAISILLTTLALKILPFLPASLADTDLDPQMLD